MSDGKPGFRKEGEALFTVDGVPVGQTVLFRGEFPTGIFLAVVACDKLANGEHIIEKDIGQAEIWLAEGVNSGVTVKPIIRADFGKKKADVFVSHLNNWLFASEEGAKLIGCEAINFAFG
jgi:hypothetical protein